MMAVASNPLSCVRIAESCTVQTEVTAERPTAARVWPSGEKPGQWPVRSVLSNGRPGCAPPGPKARSGPSPAIASKLPCGLNRISRVKF